MASLFDLGSGPIVAAIVVLAIGFLIGIVLKRAVKLGLAILSLVGFLVMAGYINLELGESSTTIIYRVFSQAPTVTNQASGIASLLPITSAAFLVGLAIGIWKG